jgi:hypothetical protein
MSGYGASSPRPPSTIVSIAALTHDLVRKRSIVTLVWQDDPEKRVALPVPFGCSLDDVHAAAEKALRALSSETGIVTLKAPP